MSWPPKVAAEKKTCDRILIGLCLSKAMHYYTHNIGEFAAQTRFMTPEEIGIFVILKDEYYANGMRLACDRIANVMPPHCEASLKRVLQRFFREEDGFLVNDEFDVELGGYKDKGEKNRENAKKRWEKKRTVSQSHANECDSHKVAFEDDANRCLTNNQEPITNNQINKKEIKKKNDLEKPEEVTEQVWVDFCKLRKEKKAPLTPTALSLIVNEAGKAGIGLNEALSISCSRGWQSFKADWLKETRNGSSYQRPAFVPRDPEPDWNSIDYGQSCKIKDL